MSRKGFLLPLCFSVLTASGLSAQESPPATETPTDAAAASEEAAPAAEETASAVAPAEEAKPAVPAEEAKPAVPAEEPEPIEEAKPAEAMKGKHSKEDCKAMGDKCPMHAKKGKSSKEDCKAMGDKCPMHAKKGKKAAANDFRFTFKKHPRLEIDTEVGTLFVEGSGQYRPRFRIQGSNSLDGSYSLPLDHRARLGVGFGLKDKIKVFASVQDVRSWGSEIAIPGKPGDGTLFGYNAAGLDMHEAYMQAYFGAISVKLGRQEINVANQRIVGAVAWTQQARSFDGVTARWTFSDKIFAEAFGARVQLGVSPTEDDAGNVTDPGRTEKWMGGAHASIGLFDKMLTLQPLLLVDTNSFAESGRVTTGSRVFGSAFGAHYDIEGFYQGTIENNEMKHAFLVAARAGYTLDVVVKVKGEFFVDVVSGDTDSASNNGLSSFDTLYATNHKFYGLKDLFLALPKHTKNQGLIDTGMMLSSGFKDFSAKAIFHVFMPTVFENGSIYGVEPDVVLSYKLNAHLSAQLGLLAFVPLTETLGRGNSVSPEIYTHINASF